MAEGEEEVQKIVFRINLPPELKPTENLFRFTDPELKYVLETITHEEPGLAELDFDLRMGVPQKSNGDAHLSITEPLLLNSQYYWTYNHAEILNHATSTTLSFENPEILLDPKHVQFFQGFPEIACDDSHTTYLNETEDLRPLLLSSPKSSILKKSIPKIIKKTKAILNHAKPELCQKTEPILTKNVPEILDNDSSIILRQTVPLIVLGDSALEQNQPIMTENYDKLELKQSVPEINLGQTILLKSLPLIKLGIQKLVHNIPMLVNNEATFQHNIPLLTKENYDLNHNVALRAKTHDSFDHFVPTFSEDRVNIFMHNLPEPKLTEEIFELNSPVLIE